MGLANRNGPHRPRDIGVRLVGDLALGQPRQIFLRNWKKVLDKQENQV